MPLLAPNPLNNTTAGVPYAPSYTGPRWTTRTVGAPPTGTGVRDNSGRELTAEELRRWDQQVAATQRALTEASGWEREKKRLELEDAIKGRENAYKIANLQAETSRYGVDVGRQNTLDQLWENQRQFDANHGLNVAKFGLEQQGFGLDVAKAYTQYASGPDMMFMRGDFMEGMERAGQGLGPSPYGSQGTPVARGWEDFAALSGFGNIPAVQAGQSAQMTAQQGGGGAAAGGGGDPRIKAATGILKAIPPSDGQGYDQDDFAALNAIESVFRASKPGSYERLRPGQKAAFGAGLSRRGYYAPDAIEQMRRNAPGQGRAGAA